MDSLYKKLVNFYNHFYSILDKPTIAWPNIAWSWYLERTSCADGKVLDDKHIGKEKITAVLS